MDGGENALDKPLVDPHLEAIPRLRALAAGRLARGDFEHFGGQAHGALDTQALALGTFDQLGRDYSTVSPVALSSDWTRRMDPAREPPLCAMSG